MMHHVLSRTVLQNPRESRCNFHIEVTLQSMVAWGLHCNHTTCHNDIYYYNITQHRIVIMSHRMSFQHVRAIHEERTRNSGFRPELTFIFEG